MRRVLTNGDYEERREYFIAKGRRQARRQMLRVAFYAAVFSLAGLGVGVVHSRAAAPPVAAGGVRIQPQTVPATRWVQLAVQRVVGHRRVPHLLQNCKHRRCAVFTRDGGYQVTMIHLADGRWRVLTIIVPDIVTTQ